MERNTVLFSPTPSPASSSPFLRERRLTRLLVSVPPGMFVGLIAGLAPGNVRGRWYVSRPGLFGPTHPVQETPLETFRTDIAVHALWDIPIYRRYETEASMYTTIDHPTTVYRLILSTGIIADVRSTLCLEPPDGLPRFRFYPPAT